MAAISKVNYIKYCWFSNGSSSVYFSWQMWTTQFYVSVYVILRRGREKERERENLII